MICRAYSIPMLNKEERVHSGASDYEKGSKDRVPGEDGDFPVLFLILKHSLFNVHVWEV